MKRFKITAALIIGISAVSLFVSAPANASGECGPAGTISQPCWPTLLDGNPLPVGSGKGTGMVMMSATLITP